MRERFRVTTKFTRPFFAENTYTPAVCYYYTVDVLIHRGSIFCEVTGTRTLRARGVSANAPRDDFITVYTVGSRGAW